jgi:hypothetical protein
MRKFYTRKCSTSGFFLTTDDCDKVYSGILEFVSEEFGQKIMDLKLNLNEVAISLGALTQPKLLLKFFKNQAQASARVQVVYDYLYKFSFERLQDFL